MKEIKRVGIIGMGSLGILFGSYIYDMRGRDSLIVIADKTRRERIEGEGIFCNGKKYSFDVRENNEEGIFVDLLIIAVKATKLMEAIEASRSFVGEDTIIISLLNGITSEDIIGEKLGKGHIIHCIAQGMDPVKKANKVTYENRGKLCLGIDDEKKKTHLDKLINYFNSIDLPYVLEEDMIYRLWSKWMLNVGVNQVVMVYKGTYETIQKEGEARDLMIGAMEEAKMLAEKEGIKIREGELINYVKLMDSLNPKGVPSMRHDGIVKNPSEVELFSGTAIKLAKKHGASVPINEMLYEEINKIEKKYDA